MYKHVAAWPFVGTVLFEALYTAVALYTALCWLPTRIDGPVAAVFSIELSKVMYVCAFCNIAVCSVLCAKLCM